MGRFSILSLRVILTAIFIGALFVQLVMIPMIAVNEVSRPGMVDVPAIAFLAYLGVAGFVVEICAICVWKLATRVVSSTVFDPASFKFVTPIIVSVASGSAATFVLAALLAPGEDIAPGIVLLIGGFGILLAGISVIVYVLRQLLVQATRTEAQAAALRTELGGVI
ncbi:DUF2975 domain-containing protein [Glutamicibacter sp. NPDC087344]|uniref:DUF2975 domain-containing protein n=1 Tax=Glutamicibacter sp. NPDC087344 TaxID=3363994 RepID=UPI0038130B58